MLDKRIERARHVPVTEIPRRDLRSVHLLVVLLGVAHEPGVLLGKEELVVGDPTVTTEIGVGPPSQLDQLGHDLVLARDRTREREPVSVRLALTTDVVEAGVAVSGPARLVGIDTIQVFHDGLHRGPKAVEVQPVEAGLGGLVPVGVISGSKPFHEGHDVTVSPHPRRETPKVRQCRVGVRRHGRAPSRSG